MVKAIANIITGERLNAFSLDGDWGKNIPSYHQFYSIIILEVLVKRETNTKDTQIEKEEIKLSLFANDMTEYKEFQMNLPKRN